MASSEFELAFIIISLFIFLIKIMHIIGRKFELPDVLGELVLGFILGPSILGILYLKDHPDSSLQSFLQITQDQLDVTGLIIKFIAEFAVLLLLFKVGTEVNIHDLKSVYRQAVSIASGGILLPLIGGIIFAFFMADLVQIPISTTGISTLEIAILLGFILSATSIGIALRIFLDLDMIRTRIAQTIVGAAVFDDILVVTILGLLFTYLENNDSLNLVGVGGILLKIGIFFLISFILFKYIIPRMKIYTAQFGDKTIPIFVSIAFMLLMAVLAQLFQLTPIIGAFVAGVIIGNEDDYLDIHTDFEPITTWIIPLFFLSIGLQIDAKALLNPIFLLLAVILTISAMVAKMLGGAGGANFTGFRWEQSKIIGLAMTSRGEVTLIFATQAFILGYFSYQLYGVIILSVVMTILLSVPILKSQISKKKDQIVDQRIEEEPIAWAAD